MESPFVDAIESFKSAGQSQTMPGKSYVLNAEQALASITDKQAQHVMTERVIKAVQSTDLQGIRLVSLYDQVGELVNEQTIFRSIAEKNGTYRSTDYQIRWQEVYAGAGTVGFFNLNNNTNPPEDQMNRGVRTNTMGAYGWTLNLPFIVSELAGQSPVSPQDEKMREVRVGLAKMRRFSNTNLLSGDEVTSELNGNSRWGGFINRSTSYNLNLAPGSNLTDAIIQGRVDAIANATSNNGLGYTRPLVALTTAAQIANIRALMIARFPGETSQSFYATQDMLESLGLKGLVQPAMTRVYQPDPGLPVVFINEPQLPSGYTIFFDPTQLQIAKFHMMGVPGPFVVERFTSTLSKLFVIFDFESLIDMLVPSRAVVSGLN